jgi:RimJ/RimL family protein N-acetyltransferase
MVEGLLYAGKHVTLRRIIAADAPLLHEWLREPSLAAYHPTLSRVCPSAADLAHRITLFQSFSPPLEIEALVLHAATELPIGIVSLAGIDRVNEKAELSFAFKRGRGTRCAAEALAFALDSAFSTLMLRKLILHVNAGHAASVRLARRAGAVEEGYLRAEVAGDAGWLDMYRFALWKEEWERGALRVRLMRAVGGPA